MAGHQKTDRWNKTGLWEVPSTKTKKPHEKVLRIITIFRGSFFRVIIIR
jgi:hypothetical protein